MMMEKVVLLDQYRKKKNIDGILKRLRGMIEEVYVYSGAPFEVDTSLALDLILQEEERTEMSYAE